MVLADGLWKAVEEVKLGDRVLATDPESGETEARRVTATITGEGAKNLVEVTVDRIRSGDSPPCVNAGTVHERSSPVELSVGSELVEHGPV